jgi:hypothetical protein
MLVKRLIKQLREPASWCVDTVYEELKTISEQCEPKDLTRWAFAMLYTLEDRPRPGGGRCRAKGQFMGTEAM